MTDASPAPSLAAFAALTFRQRQVARYVADCYTNKQIASELGISIRQVETYIAGIAARWRLDRSRNIRSQITRRVLSTAA